MTWRWGGLTDHAIKYLNSELEYLDIWNFQMILMLRQYKNQR